MRSEHQIIQTVYEAKKDSQKADALIRAYIPFIRSEVSKNMPALFVEREDAYSVAMLAFYEAILGYEKSRGPFLRYAALRIRSRLVDCQRREARHRGNLSLDEETGSDDSRPMLETLADREDPIAKVTAREAARQEIEELSAVMREFCVSFSDVADNSPKQARTLESCAAAVRYGAENPQLLRELLQTRKLPLAQLAEGSGVSRKTLERHRKYILVMLLVQTNGYEIIRGHVRHVLQRKEEPSK